MSKEQYNAQQTAWKAALAQGAFHGGFQDWIDMKYLEYAKQCKKRGETPARFNVWFAAQQ